MKKIFVFTILVCSSILVFSQQDTSNKKEEVFTIVEEMPSFPGGDQAMMKWLRDKIEQIGYPQAEKEAGVSGTSYVTFIIGKDGIITDAKTLKGVPNGPGYDKLALQVIKAMPKWNPGKQNGKEVSVDYNLPIKFRIDDSVRDRKMNDANFYYNKGVEFSKNNEYQKAIGEFNKTLDIVPTDIDALYNRGIMFFKLSKKEEACKDWNTIKSIGKPDANELIRQYCK